MRLDQTVTVTCTDTDKEMTGTVVRLRGDFVDVAVGSLILNLKRAKPGLWVGQQAGMEFVVRVAIGDNR